MSKIPFVRLLKMRLQTLLGIKRQGFFIPYRYADQLPKTGTLAPYDAILQLFNAKIDAHIQIINDIEKYAVELKNIGADGPPEPRWKQNWFPRLDGALSYTIVREMRPHNIIEVGSGHSTRFIAKAIKDSALNTEFTTIDPAPRATISQLPINIIRNTIENIDMSLFKTLSVDDILFIDSSHILLPGTDVDFLLNRVIPILPSGVILHIHDIFLPDDYPAEWAWRGYNEQQGIATLLQGQNFEIIFSSHYATTRMTKIVEKSVIGKLELPKEAIETSLWLKKK
jgi:predicted O-methyltransferase YrrM